jgi:phosphohistidine phosphatase
MKHLLILRHAKSSWAHAAVTDHDRPLNKRGRMAAPRMGALLAGEDLVPQAIVASTAVRAVCTAELAADAAGYDGPIRTEAALYHATPEAILRVVAGTPESCERLLIVGHNPGLEELVLHLTGSDERLPTGALAHVELEVASWREAPSARGRLLGLWRPRELE